MGTSYQTVLATGELAPIRAALAEAGWEAYVAPAGDRRWAVIPREEDEYGWADADAVAELVSSFTGSPAVSFDVFDSDVMRARIFVDGAEAHGYVSDRSYVSEYWDDDDNEFLAGFDGTLYPVDAPPPPGPGGADPGAFAPLGVGAVDVAALGAALRAKVPLDDAPRLFAERQHAAILAALNLRCRPLTAAFRHTDPADLPGALHVTP
ncbi:hypothetical protein [Micromonospora sp. CB01531]|uniref:hypothetical protein n=1 Tax=Micromonospora sp. CB01531 TaxID=1718947 RepID=UPI00093F7D7E|nr:hypothetical protein [Micromonospora sp. CB01531]OKI75091.1 hypothetical protein A6A27_17800 [Micromonospora sp. CB01531]